MLALALYVGTFAYGRMAKRFSSRVWLVLVCLSAAVVALSMVIERAEMGSAVAVAFAFQIAILTALFAAGLGFGRWLDRNKDLD